MEEAQLVAIGLADVTQVLCIYTLTLIFLQHLQDFIGTLHDALRHTRQLRHMDTKGMFASSTFQLSHENHLAVNLLDRHVVVLDAFMGLLHLVQFVVMGGKERSGMGFRMIMDILHDGPGDADAIIGGSASSQLIKQHQAARRQVVHDICSLRHLHHEGRFTHRDIVAGTNTGENLIHQTNVGTFRRHETTYLRHQRDESRLAEQGRFTRHIRTCDDDDLLTVAIQLHIVWHILFTDRQLAFDDRMASLADIQYIIVADHRTDILVGSCNLGKRQQAVQLRQLVGIHLNGRDELTQSLHQAVVELLFQHQDLIFCSQNLLLILFQFLGDVSFGIHQCLFANPCRWHFILVRVPHLYIIAKHIVIAHLQRWYASQFAFSLLNLQEIILSRVGYLTQFIELRVESCLYHASLVHL